MDKGRESMKICVIGLGYIGLPTAAMFASAGVSVVGVDLNPKITEALNRGAIIIEEKGLGELGQPGGEGGYPSWLINAGRSGRFHHRRPHSHHRG
jgi:UDP-N-acetyl-D-mannosaminuronate dehydrogenase